MTATLADVLSARTAEAAPELVDALEKNAVRCYACGHRCKVLEGLKGICQVRYNDGGVMKVPRGYVAALRAAPLCIFWVRARLGGILVGDAYGFGIVVAEVCALLALAWFPVT